MAIIYSYPLNDNIKSLDELVGTTKISINGQLKTVTRNFLLSDLADFFVTGGGIQKTIQLTTNDTSGPATLNETTGVLNIPEYSDSFFIFNQETPSASWSINHNLNKFPSVSVVDTAGTQVFTIANYINANSLTLTFSAPFAGKAYLN